MDNARTYECMCLLDNREVRKGWEPVKQAVTGLFTKHGAEIVSARRWDERRLAYPIKGQQRGTYLLAYVKAGSDQLPGIRRDLQFSESVLRSLMLVCEQVPEEAFEPETEFDVNAIPVDDAPEQPAAPEADEDKDEDKTEEKAGAKSDNEAGDDTGDADQTEAKGEGGGDAEPAEKAEKAEASSEEEKR